MEPIIKQKWSFILMRHAESSNNQKKDWHKSRHANNNPSSYKQSQEYLKTKFSKELLDPDKIDKRSLKESFQMLNMSQIGLILTSPLNRCLETVTELLSLYQKQRQNGQIISEVIVDPCLTSRISTAWSTGIQVQKKKQKYPSFNFEQFSKFQRHWILEILDKSLVQKYQKSDEISETILEFIGQGNLQTYLNVMQRIREFKWKLKNRFLQMSKGKKILIVSHSCLFKYIIGTKMSLKGKVDSQIELQHCDPIFFKDKFILQETYLKPLQKRNLLTNNSGSIQNNRKQLKPIETFYFSDLIPESNNL